MRLNISRLRCGPDTGCMILDIGYWLHESGLYLYPLARTWLGITEFYTFHFRSNRTRAVCFQQVTLPEASAIRAGGQSGQYPESSIQNRLIDATNRIISKSLGKKGNS